MAMITDIFAATNEDLDGFLQRREQDFSLDPLAEFPGLSLRQITLFELDSLLDLLAPPTPGKDTREGFHAASDPEDEEGLILRFPRFVVDALDRASAAELKPIATAWAMAEGFGTMGWSSKRVHKALTDIAKLCKHANSQGKSLLMAPGV